MDIPGLEEISRNLKYDRDCTSHADGVSLRICHDVEHRRWVRLEQTSLMAFMVNKGRSCTCGHL